MFTLSDQARQHELQLYKTYVRVSSDLAEAPPLQGSPRSTVSPPPGGYSSHTSSATESEALTSAGLPHALGGFSSAGWGATPRRQCSGTPESSSVQLIDAFDIVSHSSCTASVLLMACHHSDKPEPCASELCCQRAGKTTKQ